MSQTIYKMAGKLDPFARIPHALLSDERLSWKAKGIASYLCGKPDGWKMRVADLVNQGPDREHAIRSALNELRAAGYAEYVQPRRTEGAKGAFSEGVWKISDTAIFSPHVGNPDAANPDAGNQDHSKTDSNKNDGRKKESKETVFSKLKVDETKAQWKPNTRSKEKQLRTIKTPKSYPSEREFNAFIENEQLDEIGSGKRGDLYQQLCLEKWHQWKNRRWIPIHDWRRYVAALDVKIQEATAQ